MQQCQEDISPTPALSLLLPFSFSFFFSSAFCRLCRCLVSLSFSVTLSLSFFRSFVHSLSFFTPCVYPLFICVSSVSYFLTVSRFLRSEFYRLLLLFDFDFRLTRTSFLILDLFVIPPSVQRSKKLSFLSFSLSLFFNLPVDPK